MPLGVQAVQSFLTFYVKIILDGIESSKKLNTKTWYLGIDNP